METEDFYNFQQGTEIHRIAVNPELRARLVAGTLAIVRCEGRFAFVPAEVGDADRRARGEGTAAPEQAAGAAGG